MTVGVRLRQHPVAQCFFATIKEGTRLRRAWPTMAQLRSEVFDYIEVFYTSATTAPSGN